MIFVVPAILLAPNGRGYRVDRAELTNNALLELVFKRVLLPILSVTRVFIL